jgi:hypothetical protein
MLTPDDVKWVGQDAAFFVEHIHLPQPNVVLHELHEKDKLHGTVIDVSDSAQAEESPFAIVAVENLSQPCVVPIRRLFSTRAPGEP